MAETKKPNTLITKKYILERIGARKASLVRIIEEAEAAKVELDERRTDRLDDWAEEARGRLTEVLEQLDRAGNMFLPAHERVDAAKQARNTYLKPVPSELPDFRAENRELQVKIEDGSDARREYDALIHAQAYLEGLDVDAFSMASLRSLGLLSAIRFRLDSTI